MAVEKISLKKAMEKLQKSYGSASIFRGDENISIDVETVPSGSLSVDYVLQTGGVPEGRIIEISGKEGGGKTMFCASMIAEFQKNGKTCAFIDGEQTATQSWFESLGVQWNSKQFYYARPDNLEEALDHIHTLASTGEVSLVIYDSTPALPSVTEEKTAAGEVKVASISKVLTPAIRRLTPICAKNKCTVVFINQMREKIGAFSPSGAIPEDSPGGRALKHGCSLRLKMTKMGGTDIKDSDKKTIGHRIKVKCLKNKLSNAQGVEAQFDLYYSSGIDKIQDAIDTALLMGDEIIERPNSKTYIFGDLKVVGRDNFSNALKEDQALLDQLVGKVREKLKNTSTVNEQSVEPSEDELD